MTAENPARRKCLLKWAWPCHALYVMGLDLWRFQSLLPSIIYGVIQWLVHFYYFVHALHESRLLPSGIPILNFANASTSTHAYKNSWRVIKSFRACVFTPRPKNWHKTLIADWDRGCFFLAHFAVGSKCVAC